MPLLSLETAQDRAPRKKKNAKIWLGVGLVVAVLGIGSTFASNIVLNNGVATESGQGVQSIVYCGGTSQTLTMTPFSSYKNTATTPKFNITGIKVTGIPKACDDTVFILTAYPVGSDASPSSGLAVSSTASTVAIGWYDQGTLGLKYPKATAPTSLATGCDTNSGTSTTPSTGVVVTGAILSISRTAYVSGCTYGYISAITPDSGTTSAGNGSFTITFNPTNSLADASALSKITLETQDDVISAGVKPCTVLGSNYNCTASGGTLGLSY
jgi:hypothetical protein